MDFSFSPQEEVFRREFRSWLEANIPRDWRDDGELHDPDSKEEFERRRAWHRKLYDDGWMCIHWPEEYGGRGASLIEQVIYHEELDRAKAPPTVNFQGIARVGPTLMQWGTPEQKQRFIPKIPPAEEIWCQGLSEPNHGSDLAAAITSWSTAPRSGPRTPTTPTTLRCCAGPIPTCPSIRASAICWSI